MAKSFFSKFEIVFRMRPNLIIWLDWLIIVCCKIMEGPHIKKADHSKTYRIKSLPSQLPTMKTKDISLSISYTTLASQNIDFSKKIQRRVATEMAEKCTTN